MPPKPGSAKPAPPAEPAAPAEPVDPGPEVDLRKLRFRSAFKVFDPENTGSIVAEEIPTLLRYLNVFITDADWQNTVLPELLNGEPAPYIKAETLEKKAVALMEANTYEPDRPEVLYAAFRALDKANLGYVEAAKFREVFENANVMNPAELDAFIRVLAPKSRPPASPEEPKESGKGKGKDKVVDDDEEKPNEELNRIYYQDYIAMMTRFK